MQEERVATGDRWLTIAIEGLLFGSSSKLADPAGGRVVLNNTTASRVLGGGGPLALVVFVLASASLLSAGPALAKPPTEVGRVVRMDVSRPLRSIPPAKPVPARSGPVGEEGESRHAEAANEEAADAPMPAEKVPAALAPDALVPDALIPNGLERGVLAPDLATPDVARQADTASPAAAPSSLTGWEGVSSSDNSFPAVPPDPEGDVGVSDYVQWVNLEFKIWSKSGSVRYGPAAGSTLWSGFGGVCENYNLGDPQVVFDRIANRWVFMQFAFPGSPSATQPPYYLCFAVSQTSDPTGSYYRYAFRVNASTDYFPDYPKLGVWPDGYYVTTDNVSGHTPVGAAVFAFDRSKMLAGDPTASFIEYQQSYLYHYLLPASFTGSTLPPSDAPEYFGAVDTVCKGIICNPTNSTFQLWRFHADFGTPSNSNFSGPENLSVAPYNYVLCGGSSCIPQPGTSQKLDPTFGQLLQRLQYRNFGGHESLVGTHTVNVGGNVAGMRWEEIQVSPPGGTASLSEDSTYAPSDGINRWMGSVGMDAGGNIALGYSMSNGSTEYPSVGVTGSAAGSGTMGLGETTMVAGGGSQTGSSRWGDYSAMSIDPGDDETFWYTQEYYPSTSGHGWRTRIGSFRLEQEPSATLTRVNASSVAFPYTTNQNVVTIAGGCTPGEGNVGWSAAGTVTENGSVPCSSGAWSATLTSQLSEEGSYTLSAAQGAASSPSQTLTIDTTAPTIPTLTALPPYVRNGQPLSATNVSDNGGGSGVKQVNYLYCPGSSCTPSTPIGSSSTASGDYAVSWSGQPADGPYRVLAQTEDGAGNTADSSIQSTVIDNTPPPVALDKINGAAATFPYDTNQSVTSIGGSCGSASGDAATVGWSVSGAASDSGTATCSGQAWSAAVSLSADGAYTLSATQDDQAGNAGSSGNRSLTIDTTAPTIPTLTALPPYVRNGQPLSATNVSDNGGGSGVKQVNYLYCPGSSCTPSTPIGSSSTASGDYAVSWSGQPADGPYRVLAQTEDGAGNTADSSIQSTVIDNTPPPVALDKINGAAATFPYDTNQSVTSIGGSCGSASGDAATVGWSVSGAASDSGTATCSGQAWSAAVSLSADGAYTLSATQDDQAGNAGSSGNRSLTIADLPPVASFGFSPASPHVGQAVLFNGQSTSDPDGTISSYEWSFGDGASGSGATVSHAYAGSGTFTVHLSVTDNSGSTDTAVQSLTISSVAPAAPGVRLKIPRTRLGAVLRRGLRVRIASNQAARAQLRLVLPAARAKKLRLGSGHRGVVIATRVARLRAGKSIVMRLVLRRRARRHLWHARRVVVRLRALVIAPTGKTSLDRRLSLRRSTRHATRHRHRHRAVGRLSFKPGLWLSLLWSLTRR